MKSSIQILFIALALLAGVHQANAQGTTAFTYQGQLHDSSTNANGTYAMAFALYDSASGGNQIGSTLTTSPTIANGLFTVNLDFGAGAFTGAARWLDITIASQELSPRVQVLPTPYAQFAAVAATVTNGAIMNAQIAAGSVADANIVSVNGSKVSGTVANAASLTNGVWSISVGNYQSPGPLLPNSLLFSAQGTVQALFGLSGGELYINDMSCATNHANAIRLNGSGSTMSGDGSGGMTIYNPSGSGSVDINAGGITASGNIAASSMNAQAFNTTSDRNLKDTFTPINSSEILERVASLPITRWNFKQDANTRHIGPMAQDFYTAFNVGTDDKHIATVDEDGVALAAIQGLNEKLKEKDVQIEALNKRLADLEQLVKATAQK